MTCYCANYYGSINCHNTVSKFGDRCAHCLSTQGGSNSYSYSNGTSQGPTEHWVEKVNQEKMRRDEERSRRERLIRTTSGGIS
ncbi:hypothetical protein HYALB_00010700 [Hymenoscyphus albidus]|uniref:Uncharacterized protein n=1 Tax=Hymenoscyphus albidus TaxID=595503 RepID=A0A9N9LZM7_9HELO|nr:hypothetical protein HYALB_00010700 [Hymenoscyphus albidus]